MKAEAAKTTENKAQASYLLQRKPEEETSLGMFGHGAREGIAQRKLDHLANAGAHAQKLGSMDALANRSRTAQPIQKKANNTGLPDNLKSGIENLSGYSMNDVKVHYNSAKPAQLQAHAYAQGTDIHVAPGQEKHVAHEAWHVVQQKQGRVRATRQLKGTTPVNDDAGLEKEADVMGAKALQMKAADAPNPLKEKPSWNSLQKPVQRMVGFEVEVQGKIITADEDEFADEPAPPRVITKGEIFHQGAGWKLTPDGPYRGNQWTAEYIISATDETLNADQIPIKMAAAAAHAQNHLDDPASWSNGAGITIEDDGDDILGNFHITGGVRLSRISQLIKTLNQGDERATGVATRAEGIGWSGDNYKSVVALVALQISDLRARQLPNGYSAKQGPGILSRTDLGNVVAKVTKLTTRETFITEVLHAAGVAADTRLFRHQLPGENGSGRTIDDQQNLTARQWLEQLLTGRDFKWSETRNDAGADFGYDKVGPTGLFDHRADGVVVELRSLEEQGHQGLPFAQWVDVAARYTTLFRKLNNKDSAASINEEFGTYQGKYAPQDE